MKNFNLAHNLPLIISLVVVTVSLPLALFVGLTQQTSLESSAKAGKFSWEFNEKDNLEGWTGAGFAKNITANNGYLKAVTVDTKGKEIMIKSALFSPQLNNFSGQKYPQLKLRMRVSNTRLSQEARNWSNQNLSEIITSQNLKDFPYPEVKGKMILEWYYQPNLQTKAKLSSQRFIETVEDGRYHTYNFDLTNEPTWAKYLIKQIKLTPTVSNPRTVYLDWLRFNKPSVAITPTPVPVTKIRLAEIGRVIKYQPKLSQVNDEENLVLGLTTEDLNNSPIMEYDEPEIEEVDTTHYGEEFTEELNEESNVLGTSTSCKYNKNGTPLCLNMEIYPLCPNGQPVNSRDECGCPKLICPTITPFPPQPDEKFALQTDDGKIYVLENNSFVVPPCKKGDNCPLLEGPAEMPQYFLNFSDYLGKTVLVEGILEALPAQSGNFPQDTICTLSYPPTCFPGFPYPSEGTLKASRLQLAEKYATNQTLQGYLYPSNYNYVSENVYLFYPEKQNYLPPQPYPCDGNDCPVSSIPQVIPIPGQTDSGAAPSYGGNGTEGFVPGNEGQSKTTEVSTVPPYPGNLTYARSSNIDLGVFVNNKVRLTHDGYYVGERKDRFLNVKKVEPIIVTPTPYPTSIVCDNFLRNKEFYNACGISSYQYVKFTCGNGYTGILGSPNSCNTTEVWEKEASLACQQQCSVTPTPTTYKCASQGSCINGQSCPSGTSCSGIPAYGCFPPGCPIPVCLAKDTRISTPYGTSPVQDLHEGSLVLSLDQKGEIITVPLLRVSKTKVENHQVVYLVLTDGRTLWVSPKHPTVDSRTVGDLKPGQSYDGAEVLRSELIPYQDEYTYDLLPDSPTGYYFANSILLNSTLR